MNEPNSRHDIYPTDLTSAVSKANRWPVPRTSPQSVHTVARLATTSSYASSQAAAKSGGAQRKKFAAAMTNRATEDMEEETGFTCCPAITRIVIPAHYRREELKS